jgi:hypothetical protein
MTQAQDTKPKAKMMPTDHFRLVVMDWKTQETSKDLSPDISPMGQQSIYPIP